MALFTYQADANLPFLTKYYQVQLPEEFEAFLLTIGARNNRSIAPIEMKKREDLIKTDFAQAIKLAESEPPSAPAHVMERYIREQALARTFMDALADGTRVSRDARDAINEILKAGLVGAYPQTIPGIALRGGITDANREDEINPLASDIHMISVSAQSINLVLHGGLSVVLAKAIDNLFQEAQPGGFNTRRIPKRAVVRCVECENPFVARNEQQEYCSFRCKNRVAQRRAYSKRFEDYKDVKNKQ